MADEARKTLLEEIEERNCPGCNIDRFKQEQRGIPYIHLSFIWLVSLCTALPISSLFPYLYFMIRDFHVAEKEEDIGFYAGFVASSFMIGRALTSILWGKLADRYGRKPIILMATFSVIIFNTLFGLSTSFWFAISVRFLLGCVNCLLGVIRAYASEVVSEEYHALSLSVVSTSRGIGLIIGPAIGGYLAQPAKKYPNLFSQDSVFGSFPYFLPSLVISAYATGAFIACWWLPETLHTHCRIARGRLNPNEGHVRLRVAQPAITTWASVVSTYGIPPNGEEPGTPCGYTSFRRDANTAAFLLPIYSFAFRVDPPFGDKLCIYLEKRVVCEYIAIALMLLTVYLAQQGGGMVLGPVYHISFSPQSQRGAANGISMTAMSIFKSFGPAGGGILFSWAQKRQTATFLPGDDEMVFFVLNLVQLIGLILTFIPYISQNQ
ncbi:hypothetical protein YC2023_099882 [Brassica napus]